MRVHRSRRTTALLVAGLSLATTTVAIAPDSVGAVAGAASTVFINEVHYDNTGTDTGEFVEIAGVAGTDLTGWSVVLYNGTGGAAYSTLALSGTIADAGSGYGFVVVAAPGLQNGSPDGIALVNNSTLVQFLSYEGTFAGVGGAAGGQTSTDMGVSETGSEAIGLSLQLTGTGSTAGAFSWAAPAAATSGAANNGQTFGAAPPPPPPVITKISAIQGSGANAAITGTVTVRGIVTSLFQNNDIADGYFVQEEDVDVDADPATSEGIFVFCRGRCPSLAAGDLVTVTGTVSEFFGMTQINANTVSTSIVLESSGNPLPTAVTLDLPASGPTNDAATFESTEGMLVTFPEALSVSEYFQLARYGEVVLSADGRPLQFTATAAPSVAGYAAFRTELASRRIILDDDNNNQNDMVSGPQSNEPYPYPSGGLSTTNRFRGGDTITGLTGVLHWSFAGQTGTDAWRIRPVPGQNYTFQSVNPAPASPPAVGGSLKVSSFNVLNYFTTLEVPGAVCGPSNLECRGANTAVELARQRDKIVSAMASIDADVLGLIEIQNDSGASVADLVAGLNAVTAPGTYAYVDTGTIGTDAIKTAFVYQTASVIPVGTTAVLTTAIDPTFIDTSNRPALIQTFERISDGSRVTIAVNHFKSKGSACADIGDPDLGDGQGNCNLTRTAAAAALARYLATDPTGSGDPDVLIMGDLNAYAQEDPITTLEAAGYTDMVQQFGGTSAYSFVFDGQLGYLDHALASPSLVPQMTGVADWHINADEVPLFDYNDELQTLGEAAFERESNALPLYQANPLRSSDHDPVQIGLELVPVYGCAGTTGTRAQLEAAGWNVIVGTIDNDVLVGTSGRDLIVGRGGDDTIDGQAGDDLLCGGDADDTIAGGNGADVIDGANGADTIDGGNADDAITGGNGADTIDGGLGNDTIAGNNGNDRLVGNNGNDTITGGIDDDALDGGRGADSCDGGAQLTADTAVACETVLGIP